MSVLPDHHLRVVVFGCHRSLPVDHEFFLQRRTVPIAEHRARHDEQRPRYDHCGYQGLDRVMPIVLGHHPVGVRLAVVAREHFVGALLQLLLSARQVYRRRRRHCIASRVSRHQSGRVEHRERRTRLTVPVQLDGHRLAGGLKRRVKFRRTVVTVFSSEHGTVDEWRITAALGVHQETNQRTRPFQRFGRQIVLS